MDKIFSKFHPLLEISNSTFEMKTGFTEERYEEQSISKICGWENTQT